MAAWLGLGLGLAVPPVSSPVAASAVLLESGSYLLLEDGSSHLLLG